MGRGRGRIGEFFEKAESGKRESGNRTSAAQSFKTAIEDDGEDENEMGTWNGKEHKRTERNTILKTFFCFGTEGGVAWIAKCTDGNDTKTH